MLQLGGGGGAGWQRSRSKGGPERKVYGNIRLSQETRKFSNSQPNPTTKGTRERTVKKA